MQECELQGSRNIEVLFTILFAAICILPGTSYSIKNGDSCVSFLSRPTESLLVLAGTGS